jgi:sulfonate transport system permease protein
MKIVLIGLAAFFPVALSVEAGCRLVPRPYREVGQLLELSRREEILRIIAPAAAPSILSGLELGLALAWIGTIGSEYLIGTGYMNATANGLGVFLAAAREYARMDLVIVGVVALALTGLVLNHLMVRLVRKAVSWR